MSSRFTLVLIGLVLFTGSFLWWDSDSRQLVIALLTGAQVQAPPQEVVPLVAMAPESIVALELRADGRQVAVRRTLQGWDGPLSAAAIGEFLANLAGIGSLGSLEVADAELGDFGLAAPERSLLLMRGASTEPIRIDIGRSNPPMTAVYTRIDRTGPVILAGAVLAWEFDKLAGRLAQGSPREDR